MTDPKSKNSDFRVNGGENAVSRRTIVATSAWAVPAILMTATSPAHAASGASVAFDRASYSGAGCQNISGVAVTVTVAGSPSPGQSVTITLADGYKFIDGTTTFTGTTGNSGRVVVPDILVPSSGLTTTLVAVSSNARATATATATSNNTAGYLSTSGAGGNPVFAPAVAGLGPRTTPAFGSVFFKDNALYDQNGTALGAGIASFGQALFNGTYWTVPVVLTNSTAGYLSNSGQGGNVVFAPAVAGLGPRTTPAFGNVFFKDNALYDQNGTALGTGIASFGQALFNGSYWTVPVVLTNQTAGYLSNSGQGGNVVYSAAVAGLGPRTTPAFGSVFFKDNALYDQNGTALGTGIASFGQALFNGSYWTVPVVLTNQTAGYLSNSGQGGNVVYSAAVAGLGPRTTPAFGSVFFKDNALYDQNGTQLGSEIAAFGQALQTGTYWTLPVTVQKC